MLIGSIKALAEADDRSVEYLVGGGRRRSDRAGSKGRDIDLGLIDGLQEQEEEESCRREVLRLRFLL